MPGDIYYANVSALLHFDGTNGSTTITDNSSTPKTFTCNGNAALSTTQSKFGGASIALDGTGDYVSSANNSAYNILSGGDYTLEAFIYPTAHGSTAQGAKIITIDNSSGNAGIWFLVAQNGTGLKISYPGLADVTLTVSVPLNAWSHVVAGRSGTQHYIGFNGTVSNVSLSNRTSDTSAGCWIGASQSTSPGYFTGYIDEVRITKGMSRYSSGSYTVPTAAYPNNYAQFTGGITESLAIIDWRVSAIKCLDGSLVGTTTTNTTTYTVNTTTIEPCFPIITPKIDYAWSASKVASLNDYVIPSAPDTTSKLYKVTTAGTFDTTEATWNASGTTTQGTAVLTFITDLDDGMFKILGPKIPS